MVTHISPKKSNTIKPNCVAQACVQDGGSAGEESICWSPGAAPRGSMSPVHLMCPGGAFNKSNLARHRTPPRLQQWQLKIALSS